MAAYQDVLLRFNFLAHDIGAAEGKNMLVGYEVELHKAITDAAAGDASVWYTKKQKIPLVGVEAFLIPDAALTANDTNYATIALSKADGAGGARTVLASVTTQITGGTGNWTAGAAIALPLTAADTVAVGEVLVLEVTKTGTGVVVPHLTIDSHWYMR